MIHLLEPGRETLHGVFSSDFPAVLTIDPGDTVVFRTLESGWALEPPREGRRYFEDWIPERRGDGHALCGPVAIRGAEPGMTLAVRVDEVRVGGWGTTVAGGWDHPINRRLGIVEGEWMHVWTLDADALTGRNQHGQVVALRPFLGIMGMPPAEPGSHSTIPPRATGGNLDCKELTAGSTLYLPIAVPGGLFSAGDGHAVQGDGEVSVTAIECPMERVALTFELYEDMAIDTPRVRTPSAWMTLGLGDSLDEAALRALESMVQLMDEVYGLAKRDALALASLVVDLRITQMVNDVVGVHALLPHGAIREGAALSCGGAATVRTTVIE